MNVLQTPLFALCAAPASEMFVWTCINLYQWKGNEKDAGLKHDLAGNIIGALFMGACAFDAFPGARLSGSIGFVAYSLLNTTQKNPYWTTQMIQKAWEHKGKTFTAFTCGYAIYRYIPQETVSKIRDIFSKVFTNV